MSIRISNESVSAVVRGYALEPCQHTVIWLDLCPAHPKVHNAIWASLVNNTYEQLRLRDEEKQIYMQACGLRRRYHRLMADAPGMVVANKKKARLLRLIAPSATRLEPDSPLYVLEWPGVPLGASLAAMLEVGTPTPVLIEWGDYLLQAAIAKGLAKPLICGGRAPQGYRVDCTIWADLISEGIKAGHIRM